MKTIAIILAFLLAGIGITAVNGATQAAEQVNVSKGLEEIQLKVPANLAAKQVNERRLWNNPVAISCEPDR